MISSLESSTFGALIFSLGMRRFIVNLLHRVVA